MSSGQINHEVSDVNGKAVGFFVILSIIGLVSIFIGTTFFYKSVKTAELNNKEKMMDVSELTALRAYESDLLNSHKWVNRSKKIVKVPISRAIEKTVDDYNQK